MSYLAIARKWRPSTFEDLVGQSHVVQTLQNAIRFERISHAFLFSGVRGIGKTSVARIFAKALRCPEAKNAIPCNTCSECTAISEGRSIDVVEIDGASNNGVESVRTIRENVAYGASSGFYKIYIIDEVHMLSVSAFNALLKTLEEPPPHVIFILATTEVQKIPLTILSRCQRFEFRRLSSTEITNRMQTILATEKVSLPEEGLRLVAMHADGSLRDALSLLDQVLSYLSHDPEANHSVEKITLALGIQKQSTVTAFLKAVFEKDTQKIIPFISELYLSGGDLKHFTERVLEELRLIYMLTLANEEKQTLTAEQLDVAATHFEGLTQMALSANLIQVERMAQILTKTISQLHWCSHPRFVLEMAAIRMTRLDNLIQIEQALLKGSTVNPPNQPTETVATTCATPTPQSQPPRPIVAQRPTPSNANKSFQGFVDAVMKRRPLIGTLLTHANYRLVMTDDGKKKVILVFPPDSFYERQAKEAKRDIEDLLQSYFGQATQLSFSEKLKHSETSLEEVKQFETEKIKVEAIEHPMVKEAQDILGADLIDVQVEGA